MDLSDGRGFFVHVVRLVEGMSRRFGMAGVEDCLWRCIHGMGAFCVVWRGGVCGIGWQRGIGSGDMGCSSLDGRVGHHELAMGVGGLDGSSGLAGWVMMD